MRAIIVARTGGPDVLELRDLPTPTPGEGEALIKLAVAGVNFVDVYYRTGLYPTPLPFTPGVEGVGIVAGLGPGVAEVKVGERVGWVMNLGSYADYAVVPAWKLVPIPAGLDDATAAASLVQGLTAHFLTKTTYPIRPGDDVLIHAAAGGLGLLLTQMAARAGARVIGTVSTRAKADLARAAGAHDVILYTEEDFAASTRRLTNGVGVAVVYDSVGRTTFLGSLDSLRPRGMLVLCGTSSGAVPATEPAVLGAKGSLFLTRPRLADYVADRVTLLSRASDIFGAILEGRLRIRAEHVYALEEAARAHQDLETRRTTGKLVLTI